MKNKRSSDKITFRSPNTSRIFKTNENLKKMMNKDDLLILLNKLALRFKNYTLELKNNIIQKKEKISFIENNINYSHSIVNNIISHNYSFDQLKSLSDTLLQIKEKNNKNKVNIMSEEQNLYIFMEETNQLLNSIINNQKKKLEKICNNNLSNIKYNQIKNENNKYNLIDPFILYKYKSCQKRTKSQGNKDIIKERSRIFNKTQIINNKISNELFRNSENYNKSKSIFNEKNVKLNLLNQPMYKTQSTYNIEINKEKLLKNYIKKLPELNKLNDNNILSKYEKIKKQNIDYEKNIQNLNKELLKYKNLIELLTKQNNNNKEITSKNKKIIFLTKEVESLKKKLENSNIQGNITKNIRNKKLKNLVVDGDEDIYETDLNNNTSHTTHSYTNNNNSNVKSLIEKEKQIKFLKEEKIKMEKILKNQIIYINKGKNLEKENNIIKSKLKNKTQELEIEINLLNDKLKEEMNKNEEANSLLQNQKIKFEYEISMINDKRAELSKILANKNNEIIKLQKELLEKKKEVGNHKLNKKNKENNIDNMKIYYENIIQENKTKELELNASINILKEENDMLLKQNEKIKKEIIELNKTINKYEKELSKKNDEIKNIQNINNNKININNIQQINLTKDNELNKLKEENEQLKRKIDNDKYEEIIQKLKDENEGLKQFALKVKDKQEKIVEENEDQKEKIILLQKENQVFKQYLIDKKIPLPINEINKIQKKEILKIGEENMNINTLLTELNEAKKNINTLKKKNEELFTELERKKFTNDYCDNYSEGKVVSNYEEEFDLKKMAKGAKEKNRSQDINIDYPGAQQVKERYRELDFIYNSLEDLVKKLLLNCTCTNKNRTYVSELCKIVGFDEDVTYKIINNKSKKGLLNFV